MTGAEPTMEELADERAFACRLTRDRALATLEEAEAFLLERGMLTLTSDCKLPSLFGACHEEPYAPGARGFGSWPRSKWWWHAALASRPGVLLAKLHRGKSLYLSPALVAVVDPLCREALARAEQGAVSPDAARLLQYLAVSGPTLAEDVLDELGWGRARLRAVRDHLERTGILVSRTVTWQTPGGAERQSSEVARWDQVAGVEATGMMASGGLEALLLAGVHAAVLVPRREVLELFSWPFEEALIEHLLASGQLRQPAPGWLAIG
jgi:hypothetical protein